MQSQNSLKELLYGTLASVKDRYWEYSYSNVTSGVTTAVIHTLTSLASLLPEARSEPVEAPDILADSPTAPLDGDATNVQKIGTDPKDNIGVVIASSTTKAQKNTTGKRSRS